MFKSQWWTRGAELGLSDPIPQTIHSTCWIKLMMVLAHKKPWKTGCHNVMLNQCPYKRSVLWIHSFYPKSHFVHTNNPSFGPIEDIFPVSISNREARDRTGPAHTVSVTDVMDGFWAWVCFGSVDKKLYSQWQLWILLDRYMIVADIITSVSRYSQLQPQRALVQSEQGRS